MKLGSKTTITPEFLVASSTHTKAEKLELLEGMRRRALERSREADADESGPSVGTIDRAIEKVKTEGEDEPGAVIGRTTSA
jgi:hypothetical protein